jgi:hypothetical protein
MPKVHPKVLKMKVMDQVPIIDRKDFPITYLREAIPQTLFHQDRFGIKNRDPGEEFGYGSIWSDSLDQYIYAVGIIFYEDISVVRDTVELKIKECERVYSKKNNSQYASDSTRDTDPFSEQTPSNAKPLIVIDEEE